MTELELVEKQLKNLRNKVRDSVNKAPLDVIVNLAQVLSIKIPEMLLKVVNR